MSLLIVVLIATTVCALEFDAQVSPNERLIKPDQTAEFLVTINHNLNEEVVFQISSPDIIWNVNARNLKVGPKGLTTRVPIRAVREPTPGYYIIPITVFAPQYNSFSRLTAQVGVQPRSDIRDYVPQVKAFATMPKEVDPRNPFEITVNLENRNKRNISRLEIYLRSDFINQDKIVNLSSKEQKTLTFDVTVDPQTAPQEDTLMVTLVTEHEGRAIKFEAPPVEYTFSSYGEVVPDRQIDSSFLKSTEAITFKNTANDQKTAVYELQMNMFSALFTSIEPTAALKQGTYSLEISLDPREERTIVVYRNYWPIFVFFLAIALGVMAYYIFRCPIILEKRAKVLRASKGDIRDVKVMVHLVNRSSKTVDTIDLIDHIPHILEVSRDFGAGTIKPSEFKHREGEGTKLKWHLKSLRAGEEVIIAYRIKSRLTVTGAITLEPAVAKIKAVRGHKTKSNVLNVAIPSF
jgi:hypothetical protein